MSRPSAGAVGVLELLESLMGWALRIAAILLVAITGYYVFATVMHSNELFRGMNASGQAMTAQQFQPHIQNMVRLTNVLFLCSIVLAIAAVGRYYGFAETGLALVVGGALLFFGMPLLIDTMGGPASGLPKHLARLGNPRAFLKIQYARAGMVLIGVGVVHLAYHAIVFVAGMRGRRPKPNEEAAKTASTVRKKNDQFMGACWNLPFCRDTEKKLCPVRLNKKSCWRTGRGCYCDQNIILTLSGGSAYAASRGSAGYLSAGATIARPKSLSEKRAQCLQCPIYLHRQGQKYKVLAPASLVAIAAFAYLFKEPLLKLYPTAMMALGQALSGFTFGASTGKVPTWAVDMASNTTLMWMLLGVGGMLAIAYLLHGVEWMLYRLGL